MVVGVHAYYSLRLFPYKVRPTQLTVFRKGLPLIYLGVPYMLASITTALCTSFVYHILSTESEIGLYKAAYSMILTYAGVAFVALENDYFPRLSAINSIRDTWTDRNAVTEAQKRIQEMQEERKQSRTKDFEFVVNDRLTYTSLTHFRDASVRQMAEQWLKNSKTLQDNRQRLADMRRRYADAAPAQKSRMATQLLALEADVEQAESNLHAQEKAIRKALLNK